MTMSTRRMVLFLLSMLGQNNDVSWDLSVSYIVSLSASWAVPSVSNPLSIGAGDLCHAVTTVSGRILGT